MRRRLGIAGSVALGVTLVVLGALALAWALRSSAEAPEASRPPADLPDPHERMMFDSAYDQRLSRDAIPPIYTPQFVAAAEAPLQPDELVIGLVIDGEARAFPVTTLNRREMVNDVVGGTPVLVTW